MINEVWTLIMHPILWSCIGLSDFFFWNCYVIIILLKVFFVKILPDTRGRNMGRVQKKNAKNYLLIIIATSLACILCIATVVGGIHMAFGQDHKKQQDILYQNAQITKPVITQNLLTANINSRPGIHWMISPAIPIIKWLLTLYSALSSQFFLDSK